VLFVARYGFVDAIALFTNTVVPQLGMGVAKVSGSGERLVAFGKVEYEVMGVRYATNGTHCLSIMFFSWGCSNRRLRLRLGGSSSSRNSRRRSRSKNSRRGSLQRDGSGFGWEATRCSKGHSDGALGASTSRWWRRA